ncbi:MAG: hypothetical protein MJ180_00210 [Candidatus Gastranaerophilales bacterium]|nr:hypothetical protein [Candidatus Gastranaerophilales bacterium]
MGKTFDQSLIDTATIPMSMIDPEDMEDKTSEEFIGMRRIQQGCHSELSNREDFPFAKYTKNIVFTKGQNLYQPIDGRITEIRIKNDNRIEKLKYYSDIALLDENKGKPQLFEVVYNPEKIKIYPTPDKSYNAVIEYNSTKNVILTDETLSYYISIGSTLKMPEKFQHLYFDALEYYVLATNMRKQSNPRWKPTFDIFEQKWNIFLRGCQPVESDTVFYI